VADAKPPVKDQPVADPMLKDIDPTYAKEVYHFTQLIELKQSELKQLEKDNPALYKRFLGDINKLDSSYKVLKNELPTNVNREQLLEAMIQNLKLQTELLNQQLQIIQQIKQSKSGSDESNSKSL
jgi:CHASE3 domain sensor protein